MNTQVSAPTEKRKSLADGVPRRTSISNNSVFNHPTVSNTSAATLGSTHQSTQEVQDINNATNIILTKVRICRFLILFC